MRCSSDEMAGQGRVPPRGERGVLIMRVPAVIRRLALSAALFAALLAAGRWVPAEPLAEGVQRSRAVFDREGRLLRLTLAGDEQYRLWVPLKEIKPELVEATLLHEDQHFLWHPGVNPFSLARGALRTYVGRGRRIGGSTVTMQLARILYRVDSRTPAGKAVQVFRALQLEWRYSKDELLEAYLNRVPYGRNVEGVGAASLVYFGKEAKDLSLAEALTLSVIPQSPARREPSRAGPALTQARVRLFTRWLVRHPEHAEQREVMQAPLPVRAPSALPFLAPHLVEAVLRRSPAGARAVTTMDVTLQRAFERQVKSYVERRRGVGIRNASALLVDWRTMEVRALVGSASFQDASIDGQVDGTNARRSPGSALKPFIYGLGFDQGLIHPLSMLEDAPESFGGYNPENYDGDFVGPLCARDALVRSRNVPAVRLAAQLSPSLHALLKRAGISGLREESHYGLSLALGSAEVTMRELVELYAALANRGELRRLRFVAGEEELSPVPLLSPEAAFLVREVLASRTSEGTQGFRSEWLRAALPVAWKTGTSFGHRDAWAVGIAGPYVAAVWIGNFDGSPGPAFIGAEAAAPLLFELLDSVRSASPELVTVRLPVPQGVTRVRVCAISGMLPGPHCQHLAQTGFIPGVSPTKTCDVHREVLVDGRTGRQVCEPGPFSRAEVYEVWPSRLMRLFARAGLPRRAPPAANPACPLDLLSTHGRAPEISSPQLGVDYALRAAQKEPQEVPFVASADGDARELFWFVDERLVARAKPGESVRWAAKPGRYMVRAVDDRGRSDARELFVRMVE